MNVLFLMRHHGYLKNFESTLRLLLERGHVVHVAFDVKKPVPLAERLAADFAAFTYSFGPFRSPGTWTRAARDIRNAGDYLRFLHPRYRHGHGLRDRVEKRAPRAFRQMLSTPLAASGPVRRLVADAVRAVEAAIPSDPQVESFLRSHAPDVVLVTPLVEVESPQTDYVRAAKTLGLPTALCVHSWDNLTNKGLLWEIPDRVIVWNSIQAREAVHLHGVPPNRIRVTGAQAYDQWFATRPTLTREAFAARVGLDPSRPFVLYVCSSAFITPVERPFVERWIGALRAARDPRLARAGILVRPHAGHPAQWQGFDPGGFPNTAVWPRLGASPIDEVSRADYFHSLYYADAVVGINTSAMIEAGIVGRPVLSVLVPEFSSGQGGTIHFQYLARAFGGLVHLARDLDEHVTQLERVLEDADPFVEKSRRFVRGFIRPFGLEVEGTPRLADAIEELAFAPPGPPRRVGPLSLGLRWMLDRGLLVGRDAPLARTVRGAARLRKAGRRGGRAARRRLKLLVSRTRSTSRSLNGVVRSAGGHARRKP